MHSSGFTSPGWCTVPGMLRSAHRSKCGACHLLSWMVFLFCLLSECNGNKTALSAQAWPPSLVITPVPDSAAERRPLVPVPPQVTATSVTPHGIVCAPFNPAVFHRGIDTLGPLAPSVSQCELSMHGNSARAADFAGAGEPVIQQLGEAGGPNSGQDTAATQAQRTPRPFACHVCPMSFGFHSQLQVHLRSHTKETPYRCPHCFKGFSQKGNYNRHMRIHMQTGEQGVGT